MSQIPDDPFSAPTTKLEITRTGPPAVMTWQLVYVILMMILYALVSVLGGALMIFAEQIAEDPDFEMQPGEALVMGIVYAILGVGLFAMYAVGLFWRRGMGGWVYNIILIAIGLTSCCSWPLTIPILIFWIRDKDMIVNS